VLRDETAGTSTGRGQPSRSYTGDATMNELAETLSQLARSLQGERSMDETLQAITSEAVRTVPGARYAGISEVQGRRRIGTRAATADVVVRADEAQYETGQGPCLEAIREQETVRMGDIVTETRWPDFVARALDLGIRGMLSFQLYAAEGSLGALNLYADEPDVFTDESEYIGLLFASHAAMAMIGAKQLRNKDRALETRDIVGQAKGILMERYRITADQAFVLMIGASQRTNVRLTDVAWQLTQSGEMPRRSPD
jgi:GAF domain-containing protein